MTPTEPEAAHRVLLVDDDGAVRAMMNERLQRKGFEVTTDASVTESLIYWHRFEGCKCRWFSAFIQRTAKLGHKDR